MNYKDLGCPIISVKIGDSHIEKAFLDWSASVNLLPYSFYKLLGLGELKPTNITLSLDDRSIKIPRGIVEDILVQVNNFYFPIDFVVLDIEQTTKGPNHVLISLGRPFLVTTNALINCKNGCMHITFGDMTLEFNIFNTMKKPSFGEEEDDPGDAT